MMKTILGGVVSSEVQEKRNREKRMKLPKKRIEKRTLISLKDRDLS